MAALVRALLICVLLSSACRAPVRELTVAPSLPSACLGAATVNEVRVTALGDFPPAPEASGSATPSGQVSLALPKGTQVIEVEGIGAGGLVAFGRTAPLGDDGPASLYGGKVAVAYGPPDAVCPTGKLSYARAGHQATLLPSGDVLISGGVDGEGFPVPRLELYVPAGDALTPPATFRVVDVGGPTALDARAALGHAVAVLPGGDLYITGGAPAEMGVASGIAFEGMTHHRPDGTVFGAPILMGGGPRAFHTATTLGDGRVLLAGGCAELAGGDCAPGRVLGSTVIFDPTSGQFSAGPTLLHPRYDHDAILRGDGSILIVGGRGEGGSSPPSELLDPDDAGREVEAGPASGRAALLPTGAVAIVGGAGAPAASATRWLSPDPADQLPIAPLPFSSDGQTVTALEDGALLVAGGALTQPIVYDGTGEPHPLATQFARQRHRATRLADGSVLLTGGAAAGQVGGTADAFIYLRSPVGPFSSLPVLTFDAPDPQYVPRRPDRVSLTGGRLAVTAPAPGDGGRPGELALVAGMQVDGLTLTLGAGRSGPAGAALIFAWRSEADFAFVTLEPGQPVALWTVQPGLAGQSIATPEAGCAGEVLDPDELPDGGVAALTLSSRLGLIELDSSSRLLLRCSPKITVGRGAVGVGALHGTALFDDLLVSR
ncbi:MAG TPA: kelch repeat-containing protein [Polyangia bacterium]